MISLERFKVGDKVYTMVDDSPADSEIGRSVKVEGTIVEVRWGLALTEFKPYNDREDWQYLLDNGRWIIHRMGVSHVK